MLPAKGTWEHPYHAIDDAFVDVTFRDAEGATRIVRVRHKVTGEGPPVVLVHGLMTSSYSWRFVYAALARRYRVHAPDLVGSGRTDAPPDMVYSVENLARFVRAYVREVSAEPVYLVGNSLGGLYCLRALLEDDGEPIARRFVMMHSPGYPFARTRAVHGLLHAPGIGPILAGLVARVAHRYPRMFVAKNVYYARKDMMSEEECREYARPFETLAGARVFARILAESLDPAEHARVIGELRARRATRRALPCPIKLLWATKDVMVPPAFGSLYHADLPGSELAWMSEASHFLHVDQPERTVEHLLDFDRTPPARPRRATLDARA